MPCYAIMPYDNCTTAAIDVRRTETGSENFTEDEAVALKEFLSIKPTLEELELIEKLSNLIIKMSNFRTKSNRRTTVPVN